MTEIEPALLSGIITASGILMGFITASAVSKIDLFEGRYFVLIECNIIVFAIAIWFIFANQMVWGGKPTKFDLSWAMAALSSNVVIALLISEHLKSMKISEDRQQL